MAAALLSTDAQHPILPVSSLTQARWNLLNEVIITLNLALRTSGDVGTYIVQVYLRSRNLRSCWLPVVLVEVEV